MRQLENAFYHGSGMPRLKHPAICIFTVFCQKKNVPNKSFLDADQMGFIKKAALL